MSSKGISVIIPLFNKESSIRRAINSVLSQTYTFFELIIVDDGSTDDSNIIANSYKDSRIRLFKKENGGVSSARNYGIVNSTYDLVAFLDADDWWAPCFLSTLFELSNRYPTAAIYTGQYFQMIKKSIYSSPDRFPPIKEGYFELYDFLFALNSSSIIVRKTAFKDCGYFDENLTHGEDLDMWIRICLKHKVCYVSEVIAYNDISTNPVTTSRGKRLVLKNHFLSKVDQYIGFGLEEWDRTLIKLKIKCLDGFYIREPFNKEILSLINTIPQAELCSANTKNLGRNRILIIAKSIFLNLYMDLKRCYHKLTFYLGNL